jgi:hypothetical protein
LPFSTHPQSHNPDEVIWKHLKCVELKRTSAL